MSSTMTKRISSFVTLMAVMAWALLPASLFAAPVSWTGTDGGNPTFWDINTTANWDNSGAVNYFDGDDVTFDDTGTGTTVDLQTTVSPNSFGISGTTNAYTFNSGDVAGGTSIVKTGTQTATFTQEDLSFGGGTDVSGGASGMTTITFAPTTGTSHDFGTGPITLSGTNAWFNYDPSNATDELTNDFIVNGSVVWRNSGAFDNAGTFLPKNPGTAGDRTGEITLNGAMSLQAGSFAAPCTGVCDNGTDLNQTVELTGDRTITGGEAYYTRATTISGDIGHDGSGPHEITLRHRGDNADWEFFISDDNLTDANGWDVSNLRRTSYAAARGTVVFQVDETQFFNNLTTNGGSLILEDGAVRFSDQFTGGGADTHADINFSLIVEESALGNGTGFRFNTSFDVENGGTLGGNGIYRSGVEGATTVGFINALDVDVLSGGTLSPGNPVDGDGIGTMGVQGDVAFTTGGTLVIELTGAGGVAGTDFDQLQLLDTPTPSGTGNLSGLSNATLEVNISGVTHDQLSGQTIDIVLAENDLTGLSFGSFNTSSNGIDFEIIYGNGFIQLTNFQQHVPEPSTGLLIVCGALGLATRRRRRGGRRTA